MTMRQPNIIIILADNLGYGDLGCYGGRRQRTPNLDRMAREGVRFTDYYSTSGVCTPSRASLMTGCYPRRVNMHVSGDGKCVLMPLDRKGLHPDETTMADLFRAQGYATACIGKWHLGDQAPFLPTRHGFDEFFGVPYSEDMVPSPERGADWPPLPLMRGDTVVEAPPDRDLLTRRYTPAAIDFMTRNRERPFFLYLPHAMPGSCPEPFASEAFRGRSGNGIYGDCVEELDWSAGEMLCALSELGIEDRTLVVWTSDNGAVRHDPMQGSNAPLRGWGYDTSEGGQRVPCLARWPGRIPAGLERREIATMMDWLPTAARLAGTPPPENRIIDGVDLGHALFSEAPFDSPYDATGFFYFHRGQLQAVRSGPWKLYLPLARKLIGLSGDYSRAAPFPGQLFNLVEDIGETRDGLTENPDVVARLSALADAARRDLGDDETNGVHQRPAGMVDAPVPQVMAGGEDAKGACERMPGLA